ncbi:putative D,D-dipeptide-binding periplasmic protein DdpA [bacterium HR29]|jgi:peptide/nickel transport system substrate-binding protein|nr:putative D,D-dipeptide-binding periplasmic protein DdpA [bacterium HR29]
MAGMSDARGSRPLTRRRFLRLAAGLGALGAAGSMTACRREGRQQPPATLPPTPVPTATLTEVVPEGQAASTLVYVGIVQSDGEFDPHRTQSGPLIAVQSLVYSRLLAYESQADGVIVPDLALALPEQPDQQTYIFRLNPNARWHQLPPLEGRRVTADDVRYSIERQRGDESFQRHHYWTMIDRIEAPSPDVVVVHTSAPFSPLVERFAAPSSFIVAPEAAERGFSAELQIGSGPFQWVEWAEQDFASVVRNPAWHGGPERPHLAGVTIRHPIDGRLIEADFRTRRLDVAFVGRKEADRLRAALPALVEAQVGQAYFFGMRFFTPVTPYNDPRVRQAFAIAVDRRAMIEAFFAGSGDVNGWVSWPVRRWALSPDELSARPGYRLGSGGRMQDISDAKALLDAYRSEKGSFPSEVGLVVAEDAERVLGLGSRIEQDIESVLRVQVTVYPVPTAELVKRMFEGQAPWTAGPDVGWVELDDWLYPFFHSQGSNNTFALRDSQLDALIERQRTEFDTAQRRATGFEAQRRVLDLAVAVNFVSERVVALSWPYVRDFPLDILPGYEHRLAACWIDREDPTFIPR